MSLMWAPKADELTSRPRVLVIADASESGEWLVREVFMPHGLVAEVARPDSPPADVIVVDITQLQGMSLAGLRSRRERGDQAPAIVLAARLSPEAGRDLFRLGVRDFLLKPYRPEALVESILAVQREAVVQSGARQALPKLKAAVEQLRKQNEEFRVLLEVARVLSQAQEVDLVLRQVVEAAAFLTRAEDASIFLIDKASGEIFLRASKEAPETRAMLHHQLVTDSFVSHAVHTGQPVVRQPSAREGRFKVKTAYMVQGLINVPIVFDGRVGGVLAIYNRSAGQGFGEHHLILLRGLAHAAGLALDRLKPGPRVAPEQQPASRPGPKVPPLAGEVLGPEFRPALLALANETEALLRIAPKSPYRENLARLRAVVQPLLKLVPGEPAAVSLPQGAEQFQLGRVVEEALKAVRPVAELKHILILPQLAGEFPAVMGNPRLALSGLQTLMGWAIARSTSEPVALALFHMRSGEAVGPFTMTQAEGLPSGEWVAFSLIDSGPRLNTSELEEIGDETRAHHTVSPLGAGCKQVREAGGHVWMETASDGSTLYVAFRAM